jgi:hypothetical protein
VAVGTIYRTSLAHVPAKGWDANAEQTPGKAYSDRRPVPGLDISRLLRDPQDIGTI